VIMTSWFMAEALGLPRAYFVARADRSITNMVGLGPSCIFLALCDRASTP
jgi:hypothetical protein